MKGGGMGYDVYTTQTITARAIYETPLTPLAFGASRGKGAEKRSRLQHRHESRACAAGVRGVAEAQTSGAIRHAHSMVALVLLHVLLRRLIVSHFSCCRCKWTPKRLCMGPIGLILLIPCS